MRPCAVLQARLNSAFANDLKLTAALRGDLEAMLSEEQASFHWRRNFVRASAPLSEGHAHCLRQMCAVGQSIDASAFAAKERRAIANEGGISANERLE